MTDTGPDPQLKLLNAALRRLAGEGRCASYAELAELAGYRPPHRIHRLTEDLEMTIREDHAAGRPLRAAFAVSRGAAGTAGIPGRGFFMLLQELGRYDGPPGGPEAAACHARELAAALAYWTAEPA
jgi:hypothetical protein